MRTIQAVNGGLVSVDDEDYENLIGIKWVVRTIRRVTYAQRKVGNSYVLMHREIMRQEAGGIVDHIDGNGLNNQRGNLRLVTHAQNVRNRANSIHSSQYKGVSYAFRPERKKHWQAKIKFECKTIWLGRFEKEIDAGIAYDRAAVKYFGEYARLNFPAEPPKVEGKAP